MKRKVGTARWGPVSEGERDRWQARPQWPLWGSLFHGPVRQAPAVRPGPGDRYEARWDSTAQCGVHRRRLRPNPLDPTGRTFRHL